MTPLKKQPEAYETIVGTRPHYMLAFQKSSGERFSYAYIHLSRVIYGLNKVVIECGRSVIHVEGSHLAGLVNRLERHEIAIIYEGGRTKQGTGEDVEITRIVITQGKADETS